MAGRVGGQGSPTVLPVPTGRSSPADARVLNCATSSTFPTSLMTNWQMRTPCVRCHGCSGTRQETEYGSPMPRPYSTLSMPNAEMLHELAPPGLGLGFASQGCLAARQFPDPARVRAGGRGSSQGKPGGRSRGADQSGSQLCEPASGQVCPKTSPQQLPIPAALTGGQRDTHVASRQGGGQGWEAGGLSWP